MSTPLTDSINALTTYANEVTGASDTTLSDAVHTLASGYGGGASGNIKTESGTLYIDADINDIVINHGLGGTPDFAYICADYEDGNLIPYDSCVMCSYGFILPPNAQGIIPSNRFKYIYVYRHPTSGNLLVANYQLSTSQFSDTKFTFIRGQSTWRAKDTNDNPIPYKWILGRFVD